MQLGEICFKKLEKQIKIDFPNQRTTVQYFVFSIENKKAFFWLKVAEICQLLVLRTRLKPPSQEDQDAHENSTDWLIGQ